MRLSRVARVCCSPREMSRPSVHLLEFAVLNGFGDFARSSVQPEETEREHGDRNNHQEEIAQH